MWLSLVGLVKNERISVSLTPDLVSICPWLSRLSDVSSSAWRRLWFHLSRALRAQEGPLFEEHQWRGTWGLSLDIICPNRGKFQLLSSTDREGIVLTTTKAMSKCYSPQKKRSRKGCPHKKERKSITLKHECWEVFAHSLHLRFQWSDHKWPAEMRYHFHLVLTCIVNVSCDHLCYLFFVMTPLFFFITLYFTNLIHVFDSTMPKKGIIAFLFDYILKIN